MSITEKTGIVVSTKMDKTIVVVVENKVRHPQYLKTLTKTKRYLVHDENNIAKLGDRVILGQTRPISKRKSWTLKSVIQ
jgi:small subunit ribosomal protein S17